MNSYWKINKANYERLQPLKQFVDFVSTLPYASEIDKNHIQEIKGLIETIDQPSTFRDWNVCINIFDREAQDLVRQGVYWRSWSVFFEYDFLEIQAKTRHTEEPHDHWGDDFHYWAYFHFEKEFTHRRIYMD